MCWIRIGQPEALKIAALIQRSLPQRSLHTQANSPSPISGHLKTAGALPTHKIIVDDDARTHFYISEESGEVDLLTTRGTAPSRMVCCHSSLDVLCSSSSERRGVAAGCLVDIRHRRNPGMSRNRSRIYAILDAICRMMRWHYVSGVAFGVFSLTWVFSGLAFDGAVLLGLEWRNGKSNSAGIARWSIGPCGLSKPAARRATSKQIDFVRIQASRTTSCIGQWLSPRLSLRILSKRGMKRSRRNHCLRVCSREIPTFRSWNRRCSRITTPTTTQPSGNHRFPVLRVKFGDPDATWFYIDPRMSQVVDAFHPTRTSAAVDLPRLSQPRFQLLVLPGVGVDNGDGSAQSRWVRPKPHWCDHRHKTSDKDE